MEASTTGPEADAPVRVCRKCSTQSQTAGEFCPHCGARFGKRKRSRRARALLLGVPLAILLIGGGVAAGLVIHHNNQVAAAHKRAVARATAARQARQQQQQAAQSAAQANQALQSSERLSMVNTLQSSVKKTAEQDVSSGALTGPILEVQCQPATAADATATIANYTCVAANKVNGTSLNGYRFTGTINITTGSLTWRLGS